MDFEIKAIFNDKLNKECQFNIRLLGDFTDMKIFYKIVNLGNQYEPINKLAYESETINKKKVFNQKTIPLSDLCQDEALEDNMVEISFINKNHSDELGKYNGSITKLLEGDIKLNLKENKRAKIICRKKNFFSLIDYLERDIHLNTSLAIDFSETNEINTHHLGEGGITVFGNLMNNFIDLLWPYNDDEFFYIFGYGFELLNGNIEEENLYPINRTPESPSTQKNNIMAAYSNFLKHINFSKIKSNLNLIIKKFNEKIKEEVDLYDINEYNILLLFVNNDIYNNEEFANEIILSSELPISVVIIGLGKGPFKQLENSQKNFMNLKDSNKKRAKRKNFKFVSFNKLDKNYLKTVKNALIGIPDQMIEFFTLKNIIPESIK